MTLDEAIKCAEEVAEVKKTLSEESELQGCSMYAIRCGKSAEEHRQLAKWLRELKAYKEQQPCEDVISREAAIMCMTGKYIADLEYKPEDIISQHIKRIKALPSATPKQKTGKWNVLGRDDPDCIFYRCSECHMKITLKFNYCPNCGAKMENEE